MKVERDFLVAALASLAAAAVSRAPTLMGNGTAFGVTLGLNVGYVVLLGPLAILVFYVFADRGVRAPGERIEDHAAGWLSWVVILLPAACAAYLVAQYFHEVRPQGQCNDTGAVWALWGQGSFQPTYCVGDDPDMQARMPHLVDPPWLWSLLQLLFPAGCIALAARVIQATRAKLAAQRAVPSIRE